MLRIGHGFDLHRTGAGGPLTLGGIQVPWDRHLVGHSDADALLHAVTSALLGALALGDLGHWFPDTDPALRGADSRRLLQTVLADPAAQGWELANLDCTVIAERPRLAPHISAMRDSIAGLFAVPVDRISVKATTYEGVGEIGRGDAIAAHAVLLLTRPGPGP
jgi:2-C-methyl-D-erythritol 2,4-cyclodiphosphate synthase